MVLEMRIVEMLDAGVTRIVGDGIQPVVVLDRPTRRVQRRGETDAPLNPADYRCRGGQVHRALYPVGPQSSPTG